MHAAAGEQAVGVDDAVDEVDDVNVYAEVVKRGGEKETGVRNKYKDAVSKLEQI